MLICQLTDLHIRPRGRAANRVSETNMFFENACRVVAAHRPRPDLVLITGDITESGQPAEYANFTAILGRTLDLPVYVIPGNHDHRENLRAALAHLPGVTADPTFVQYTIEDRPVRVVMLDTLVPGHSHGELCPERLDWLDRTLAAVPGKQTMIAMHHPPTPTGIPHMDRIALRDADAFREIILRHPQVDRIICGHHHRPIVGHCAQAIVTVAPSVAHQVELTFDPDDPGAFNFEPPAFQWHVWTSLSGFVTHTAYVDRYPGPFPFLSAPEQGT